MKKTCSSQFKSKVALEALQGDKTLAEIVDALKSYNIRISMDGKGRVAGIMRGWNASGGH